MMAVSRSHILAVADFDHFPVAVAIACKNHYSIRHSDNLGAFRSSKSIPSCQAFFPEMGSTRSPNGDDIQPLTMGGPAGLAPLSL